jgi:excisionase family DNA binding protein
MNNPFEAINQRLENIEENLATLANKQQPEPPKSERYLTTEQVSEMLSVSRVTLWTWAKKGILNPVKFGNLSRYKLSEIENLGGNSGENGHQKKVI